MSRPKKNIEVEKVIVDNNDNTNNKKIVALQHEIERLNEDIEVLTVMHEKYKNKVLMELSTLQTLIDSQKESYYLNMSNLMPQTIAVKEALSKLQGDVKLAINNIVTYA